MSRSICRVVGFGAVVSVAMLCGSVATAQPIFQSKTTTIYLRQTGPTSEPTGRVEVLIGDLSDESAKKRDAATASLLKMGPKIEPQLRWALDKEEKAVPADDLKMRWSTKRIKEQWGPGWLLPRYAYHSLSAILDDMEDQSRAMPSLVTLHHTDALLTDVLLSFGRQIDADVVIRATNDGYTSIPSLDWVAAARMTINVERANYWDAVGLVIQSLPRPLTLSTHAGGLELVEHPDGSGALEYERANGMGAPMRPGGPGVVVSGPMLIGSSLIGAGMGAEAGAGGTVLTLAAVAEPRVTGVTRRTMVRIDECVDDRGRSLLNGSQHEFYSPATSDANTWPRGPWTWKVQIPLEALAPGRRVGMIRGHFSVGVGPQQRYIPLTGLTHLNGERSASFDGVVVTVKSITPRGSLYDIHGEVSSRVEIPRTLPTYEFVNLRALDESRQLILAKAEHGEVRHEAGRAVVDWTLSTMEMNEAPATLMWLTPEDTRWFTVPFEIRDVGISQK